MNTFSPGERALVVPTSGHVCDPHLRRYIGQAITVISPMDTPIGLFYRVQADDGREFAARPLALQKLPPQTPREQTVSWDRCVWAPDRVLA